MERLKSLARTHLPDQQVQILRRCVQAWRDWRQRGRAQPGHYTVTDLRHASRQLWAGHSETARRVLTTFLEHPATPHAQQARAALQFAKLHASNGEWAEAESYLSDERLQGLEPADRARALVLKAVAAMEIGRIETAASALEQPSITVIGKNQQGLLRSNLEYYRDRHTATSNDAAVDRLRLEHLNRIYRDAGMVEIQKRDPQQPLALGNIEAREVRRARQNRESVISVLVPCFNAEATIGFAIDSILAQTHDNVEVLCIDDCSNDSTRSIVEAYVQAGAPVRLLVNERNSGPYFSRNRALAQASGDFVTVQDADDWMHPERLELQVAALSGRWGSRVSFSFTRLARVADGFLFTLRPYRPMLEPIHWNYTSIMGARETFLELGGWDPVVAHADAEFIDRIKDVLGAQALRERYEDVPMALFTDGPENLTKRAGTGLTSVGFGARREYQEQAREWRKEADTGAPDRGLLERPSPRHPFYAPNALLPPHLRRDTHYDFVFITDMSLLGGTRRCNLEYFRICAQRGWRVGVFNYPRYRGRGAGSIDRAYRRLFDLGDVDLLTPEDEVEASAVIVHHPPILDARIDRYPTIHTARVALLVNQLPYQSRRPDAPLLYHTGSVALDLKHEFGCPPVWIPISGLVRAELERFIATDALWGEPWYPVVDWVGWRDGPPDSTAPGPEDRIRVGRHSRDHPTKWPDTPKELRQVYPETPDIEVQILGGAERICGGTRRIPANWTVHPFDSIDVGTFLAEIDVFIHWTRSDYIEEFGRNVAEAMACGVPCILSRDLEPTFGEAALYPAPQDVADTVRALARDPELRDRMIARGHAFVADYCAADVAGERMGRLLPEPAATQALA